MTSSTSVKDMTSMNVFTPSSNNNGKQISSGHHIRHATNII